MEDELDAILENLQRDLSQVGDPNFKAHCRQCHGKISSQEGLSYTNNDIIFHFHEDCFVCSLCTKKLGDEPFYTHEQKPHCTACYQIKILGTCERCNQPLADGVIKAGEKRFHLKCFTCSDCNVPFESQYFEKTGKYLCKPCYEASFAPLCEKCGKRILPDPGTTTITSVTFKGKPYHAGCFGCKGCEQPLPDFKGFQHQDEIYCRPCFDKILNATSKASATAGKTPGNTIAPGPSGNSSK
ncbi:uncharacterized protein BJ171DRAFT_600687 [Polychytrium aggregatum]|uniref:uncharacterized protein n=1 Tax=Polychytrium aggregatum TaxID=110093 RepID=UPI0022FDD18F|nr:uncharacterized protein BJ171DRAFT_600687 [Polychytrium aggregatum]KAI9202674.1 hypothetical protein BJ171DRAFT_600687 [Polychytrium aggregatum]